MKATIAALAGLFLMSAAGAEEPLKTIPVDRDGAASLARDKPFPYTYAGLGYFHTEYDSDIGQDGFALEGSFLVLPNIVVTGMYYSGETDDIPGFGALDVSQLNIGGGYRHPLSMTVDLVGTLEFVQAEVAAGGDSASENGYEVDVAIRGLLMDGLEGKGELQYLDVGEDADTYFNVQALYAVLPTMHVGADLLYGDDQTSYGIIGRYSF